MFDTAQATIIRDRAVNPGSAASSESDHVLSYLVANMTRWTTHCIAFMRLLCVRRALTLEVMQHRNGLIQAQVLSAKSTEKQRLTEEAEMHCDIIADPTFWEGLEHVVGDIEPICFGTNINQKDSTRLDQVLMTLIGMFLHFAAHPIEEVANGMKKQLEKRWKDAEQPIFLLALILNPFEGLSCFGEDADMGHFKCNNMLVRVSVFLQVGTNSLTDRFDYTINRSTAK